MVRTKPMSDRTGTRASSSESRPSKWPREFSSKWRCNDTSQRPCAVRHKVWCVLKRSTYKRRNRRRRMTRLANGCIDDRLRSTLSEVALKLRFSKGSPEAASPSQVLVVPEAWQGVEREEMEILVPPFGPLIVWQKVESLRDDDFLLGLMQGPSYKPPVRYPVPVNTLHVFCPCWSHAHSRCSRGCGCDVWTDPKDKVKAYFSPEWFPNGQPLSFRRSSGGEPHDWTPRVEAPPLPDLPEISNFFTIPRWGFEFCFADRATKTVASLGPRVPFSDLKCKFRVGQLLHTFLERRGEGLVKSFDGRWPDVRTDSCGSCGKPAWQHTPAVSYGSRLELYCSSSKEARHGIFVRTVPFKSD